MSSAVLKVNDANWVKYVQRATSPNSYTRQLIRAWVIIYLADMQRRFNKNSRGGGDWKAIKRSTAQQKGNDLILVQIGKLKNALQLWALGNKMVILGSELAAEVGFSNAMHDKKLSFNQLARIHQNGEGNVPAREILVPPSQKAMRAMVRASQAMFDKMSADLKGGR